MYDSTTPKGFVIKSDPDAGTQVVSSTTITMYVSMGPDPGALISVPDLSGLTQDAAKAKLESAGLKLGSVSTGSSDKTAGTVIDQSPKSGSQLNMGKTVDITISSGQSMITVPDFKGKNFNDVSNTQGLNIKEVIVPDSSPAGTVISQDITKNTKVASGTTVTLSVSSGVASSSSQSSTGQ